MRKPVEYHIWWTDHRLERGPVFANEAADILTHHLRTHPDDPVWLLPTVLCTRSVIEVSLLSSIRRLRDLIESFPKAHTTSTRLEQKVTRELFLEAFDDDGVSDKELLEILKNYVNNR